MKKTKTDQKYVKKAVQFSVALLASVIYITLISGCGTKSVSRISSDKNTESSSVEDTTANPLLECVIISADFISAKASTYYDTLGQLRTEAIKVQISNLITDFDANRGHYLQFFRWKANETATALDPNAATIRFESRLLAGQPISGNYSYINHAKMVEMANEGKLSGSTVQAILEQVTVVITGFDFEDDAIKVVIYDKDGAVVKETDFLIPAFSIDPSQYEDDHGNPRSETLMQLHPYISSLNDDNDTPFYEALAGQSKNCFGSAF